MSWKLPDALARMVRPVGSHLARCVGGSHLQWPFTTFCGWLRLIYRSPSVSRFQFVEQSVAI